MLPWQRPLPLLSVDLVTFEPRQGSPSWSAAAWRSGSGAHVLTTTDELCCWRGAAYVFNYPAKLTAETPVMPQCAFVTRPGLWCWLHHTTYTAAVWPVSVTLCLASFCNFYFCNSVMGALLLQK